MLFYVLGGILLWFGGIMMVRGWIYFLRPEGKLALKRKARNVELGFPTDMKVFGRKVRRLGFIAVVLGGVVASVPMW